MSDPLITDWAIETAERLRRLVEAKGIVLYSALTTGEIGKEVGLGDYVAVVNSNNELYAYDRRVSLDAPIFTQKGPCWAGRGKSIKACSDLLLFLREHMVLEDLADV